MTLQWFSTPMTFVSSPWWAWRWDDAGEYVEMGHTLPCGHEVRATSRVSNEQLRRNYDRMVARHVCKQTAA